MTLTLFSRSLHFNTQKVNLVCTLSFFLHILISIIRNLNIFWINLDIHEMLLLQKKNGQGSNTGVVIPLCNSLMSLTLLVFVCLSCLIIFSHYAVKSSCAHYLFNTGWKFDQTSTGTLSGWGKEVIRFWWPWPYFQGHYIINTQKVSLVCTQSHESIDGLWPN